MRKVYVIIGKDPSGTKFVVGVYSSLKKARHEMAYFKALKDQEFFIETHILL